MTTTSTRAEQIVEKNKVTFLKPNFVTHEVNEGDTKKNYRFFPMSVGLFCKLDNTLTPLIQAVVTLFDDTARDNKFTRREVANEHGSLDTEHITEATPVETLRFRHEQKQAAVVKIVSSFTGKTERLVMAELIMDSLAENFPRGEATNPTPEAFLGDLPLPVLTDLLVGVAKANKGVFGPLAGTLQGKIEAAFRNTPEIVAQAGAAPASSEPEKRPTERQSPSPAAPSETPG